MPRLATAGVANRAESECRLATPAAANRPEPPRIPRHGCHSTARSETFRRRARISGSGPRAARAICHAHVTAKCCTLAA